MRSICAVETPNDCAIELSSSELASFWSTLHFGEVAQRHSGLFVSPHATFCGHGCADRAVHGRWPREAIPLWVRRWFPWLPTWIVRKRVPRLPPAICGSMRPGARLWPFWPRGHAAPAAGRTSRAALGWVSSLTRALPLCTVGTIALSSICSLVSVIVSMPPAPFAFHTYVHYGQHPYSWIIPVKVLKESSVFPEYIARFRAARLPDHPSDAAHKQLFDAHECH